MTTYDTLQQAADAVSAGHACIICTCGTTLQNCRCISPDKTTVAVKNGCDKCKENEQNG